MDDLPQRGPTHVLEDETELALRNAVRRAGCFIVQSVDRHDYGSDIQLEAMEGSSPTNCRVHLQLKGTTSVANRDGSVSIGDVERTNLNYLLSTPRACYVGYHARSQGLLVRTAEDVFSEYEREHTNWQQQRTITVRFRPSELFDDEFQRRLRDQVLASHRVERDQRLSWTAAPVEDVPALIRDAHKSIRIPADFLQAYALLEELYDAGEDRTISAHYAEFKAVLGNKKGRMLSAHMAEINLAMNTRYRNDVRLESALSEIDDLLSIAKPPVMALRYTRANCLSAMRRDEEAIPEYRRALEEKSHSDFQSIGAQCWRNLGTSLKRIGADADSTSAYEEALKLDPDLPEAKLALAHCHAQRKDFTRAAELVDGITRSKSSALDRNTIQGWKAHYLSMTGSPEKALNEILDLIGSGHKAEWIWPWSANLVVRIGRTSPEALGKALIYWRRYLHEHPNNELAQHHRLLCLWALRQHLSTETGEAKPATIKDGAAEIGFAHFRNAALSLSEDEDDGAFWWDRIGHWAQADGDWQEAESAYRKAYSIQPHDYEYCLGTALNQLSRYSESLPLLISAATVHDDSMGWHQLGIAHAGLRDWISAVAAYERAIERDPSDPNPWFDLGGAHWNARDYAAAKQTWQRALERFPDAPSASKARELLAVLDHKAE